MLVVLIGKKSIHKITLPQIAMGNYWLSDKDGSKEKKLININGINGNWHVASNNFAKIIDLKSVNINNLNMKNSVINVNNNIGRIIDNIILKEHDMYGVRFENSNEFFVLCCLPVFEKNFFQLNVKSNSEIYIGNGIQNDISYENELVLNKHVKLYFNNKYWTIENYDKRFGIFVNNQLVKDKGTMLSNGDVIFIMGLKLIVMGKTIFINNPKNKIICNNEIFSLVKKEKEIVIDDTDEKEANVELYEEEDYFSRAPRITNIIECEKVKIDAPPHIQDKEEMPLALVLGSSLSMGAMMIISIITAIDGKISGTATTKETVFSLVIAVTMLISMIVFPSLSVRYERKKKKKYEERRQKRYKEYLNKKNENINKIKNKQREILFENHISPEECSEIILNKSGRLWERKIEDYDFLTVRLGIGDVPLNIDVQYPEEQFAMEDDNLVEILNEIGNNSKILGDAPIVTSLVEKNVSALIIQEEQTIEKFIKNLIIQLITFHSYEDLKLVFLLKEDKKNKWEYVKMLPHVWNNTKQVRFFSDDFDEMKQLSKYLEEELNNRLQYENKDYKSFMPYYLIITDDYKKIENLKIITEILKTKLNVGFSILCITNDLMQLPNECKTFISLGDKTGTLFENEISSTNQRQITFDTSVTFFFDRICQKIANIPIKYTASGGFLLPNSYTFLEMYDAGRIEQLNILERWNKNDSTLSLKAPIGVDNSGMPIILDIHEKFHGPHGLIAGSTGSGKSEFIITYILSLAINYHPDDVTFILIDYKGGGLAGAFQKRDIKLPHLVGTITNIDTNGLQRSLASIQSELRRRQVVFNEARNMTDEGTIDIYKYQKLYHEGVVKEAIPHLLIICDEFAELRQQQEDFMEELMSVSRIGRSLGVHLILATQKPAGIVNDQIRSNSKFAVCLKVQDREDSSDVIKRPDAANLKKAGQFYLQVGNNEYFVMGQSAWAGAPYFPSDITEKRVDNSIEFISNIGTTIKQVDDTSQRITSNQGEQLTNIVRYIHDIAKQKEIKTNNLWLENIPETIFVKDLRKKYKNKVQKNKIEPIIGEYDNPNNQCQGLVNMDLSNQSNTVIYGNAESGKETLLSTMVYELMTTHSTEEVQLYLLDFGSEALKIYKEAPHVGDVVFINDTEKIGRFFDMLQKEIKQRKEILSEYNGDYNLFLNTSGKNMPTIVVAMNNYEAFSEMYDNEYDDIFLTLTRECVKYGIIFVVTVSTYNDMRYRLSQNFKQKIALQLNNEDDYYNIFERVGKKRPSHIFGRGLIELEDGEVFEFQTAKICEPEQYNLHIKEKVEETKKVNIISTKSIPVIPNKISLDDVREYLKDLSSVPIGITKKDLKVINYDFRKSFINIITSKNIEDSAQFVSYILEEIKTLKNTIIRVFDAERVLSSKKIDIKNEYINFISDLENIKNQHVLCIIIGIDKFVCEFDDINNNFDDTFNSTLRKAEGTEICNFIFVENVNKLKNNEYEEWFKNYISKENGIWVGNGIDSQYLINISSDRNDIVNNCGSSYGYVIKQENATLIKLLEMREDGDDDE